MMPVRYVSFLRQSDLIKGRLLKINESVKSIISNLKDKPASSSTVVEQKLLSYLEESLLKYEEFNSLLNQLMSDELSEDYNAEDVLKVQDEISDTYLSTKSYVKAVLPEKATSSSSQTAKHSDQDDAKNSFKLPKLQLPIFSGKTDEWVTYFNLFDTTVNTNKSLNPVTKFQYLLSTLSGEPLSLVKSLPLSQVNYRIAWDTLVERYHNPRLLINFHMNQILDLQPVTFNSVKGLRHFVNVYMENSSALKALDCDISNEITLLTVLLKKLDPELRKRFEDTRPIDHSLPKLKDLIGFLQSECIHLEESSVLSQPSSKTNFAPFRPTYNAQTNPKSFKAVSSRDKTVLLSSSQHCNFCTATSHNIYQCDSFKKLPVQKRFDFVKSKKLCTNCLSTHAFSECNSNRFCLHCNKRHHSLIHLGPNQERGFYNRPDFVKSQYVSSKQSSMKNENAYLVENSSESTDQAQVLTPNSSQVGLMVNTTNSAPVGLEPNQNGRPSGFIVSHVSKKNSMVVLGTCLVKIETPNGNYTVVRGILDSGSETSIITERIANLLGTQRFHAGVHINALSSTQIHSKGVTKLNISNISGDSLAKNHPLLILDKIVSMLPHAQISPEVKEKLKNYVLADPTFDTPSSVDFLIGVDLFASILTGEQISLGENMPIALGTKFGFVVIGKCPTLPSASSENAKGFHTLLSTQDNLHVMLQKFWELNEPPSYSKPASKEDVFCEEHFKKNVSRDTTGRYVVRLPFVENAPKLGQSLPNAEKRFYALESKLNNNPEIKKMYVECMREYESSGHMTKSELPDLSDPTASYFLPHHPVFKQSTTTQLRVVFDASCRTSSSVSINDILHCGPKLQNEVTDIIILFRENQIVFSCDIKAMYRQILMHPSDQFYQFILWREDSSLPLSLYRLQTVTFGFKPAPFLAIRTLQQLVEDEGKNFPLASKILKDQIFMDDILSGCNDLQTALALKQELVDLLKLGGFHLRKWTSNCSQLLETVIPENREKPLLFKDTDQPLYNILGLKWTPDLDTFSYDLNSVTSDVTKRSVLSTVSQIFDPCGFLAPVVFWAKCLIQCLWALGLNWDEPLPQDLKTKWLKYLKELPALKEIQIPRCFNLTEANDYRLCGFCDSSEQGFAAQVYIRCQSNKEVKISLLIAKTKVAPLKKVSLPRLELCSAHLLAKLLKYCTQLLSTRLFLNGVHAWSDSTITLSWIQTPPYKLKVFVANRVAEIQELLPTHVWSHVSTKENPADIASRGILPAEFVSHHLWFQGPSWLSLPLNSWPKSTVKDIEFDSLPETKSQPLNILLGSPSECELLTKYSSWPKLQTVVAYILRFIHNSKPSQKEKFYGALKVCEVNCATKTICKIVQRHHFEKDISLLLDNKQCSTRLARLSPFVDEDKLLRVGGRLKHASILFGAKHPIILPKTHHVTTLLITYYHFAYLHAGPQLLQSVLCRQFWILSARSVIRSCIFKCIQCFKCRPTQTHPLMGDLPLSRLQVNRPFSTSGVDLCGPFQIKLHTLKRAQSIKAYLCIFICFTVKAVHVEVLTDMSTDSFIAALTRFVSRRGFCSHIYSDHGSNFLGADLKLRKIIQNFFQDQPTKDLINTFSLERGIVFHFNPPAAPHQGGLWERAVKSIKHHLRRVVGNQILTLEEFSTLSTRIEAMMNSRPLTPLSSDPNEFDTLTPGHFLIGSPLVSIPEPNLQEIPLNRLKRWQVVQSLSQRLWRRWSNEYLHTMQQRLKWTSRTTNLQVGQLVLLQEPNTPSLCWPLARITAVSPGADGVVRVVHLKTSTSSLTRPAVKIFPLPVD